jgi:phage terminase large subunit
MVVSLNGKRGEAETLRLRKNGGNTNPFLDKLRGYNLIDNKHIPQEYISNSEEVRLELLAGLLDTDGCMSRNGYEIIQKRKELAKQIKYIADTLGFRTSITEKRAKIYDKDCGLVYRVFINGDVWRIPCKVERKKVYKDEVRKNKDWHLSQLSIEYAGKGEWCGIHLDGNQRYIHSDGTVTHNSGKSYNSSRFIERLTFEYNAEKKLAHQILYTRFTMVSAAISVIPEFWEKVEVDETEQYFRKTKTDVINTMTGARVMFRGIHTSSGNQTAKLKSIQGVTTFVVDEAEEWVSEDEFERIMLSIRTKGLQNRVIIIMNPADSNHWVYKRFIEKTHKIVEYDGVPVQISTHPNVLHIHTTYLDNIQNLSEEFLKEVLDMKINKPERYAHIVMGRWADVAEGAVFKKWGIIDEFPEYAKKIGRCIDFGYTNDVTAIARCGIVDNRLYIDELCYRNAMTSGDICRELRQEASMGNDGFVYSESADPRLIDEIALGGVIIYPVAKGAGSIEAGISKMLDYEIYVTKRSLNAQHELRNYVYAKDKDGHYTNIPEDHDNHILDAVRYYFLHNILGHPLVKRKVTKEQLGVY